MKLCMNCKKVGKCGKPYSAMSNYAGNCRDFEAKKPTVYDRIINMSIEEMATLIPKAIAVQVNEALCEGGLPTVQFSDIEMEKAAKAWKEFLESEVEE